MPVYRNNLPRTGGSITPTTNSLTTFQVTKQDGTTNVFDVDTTNARLGIGTAAPGSTIEANSNTQGGTGEIRVDSPAVNQAQFTFYKGGLFKWQNYVPGNSADWRLFGGSADRLILQTDGKLGLSITPTSMLHVAGSIATAIINKTGAYIATASDSTITADASGGAFQITLPTAVGITGRVYTIKRTSASNNVTVGTTSSQTIDGAASKALASQYALITVQSDGTNWSIVGLDGTVT